MEGLVAEGRANRFRALPIFIEESTHFYNADIQWHDGRWAYGDEVTTRHANGGFMAFIDGSADKYKPNNITPEDPNITTRDAFGAYSVFLRTRKGQYYRTDLPVDNPLFRDSDDAWGWINDPREAP